MAVHPAGQPIHLVDMRLPLIECHHRGDCHVTAQLSKLSRHHLCGHHRPVETVTTRRGKDFFQRNPNASIAWPLTSFGDGASQGS